MKFETVTAEPQPMLYVPFVTLTARAAVNPLTVTALDVTVAPGATSV